MTASGFTFNTAGLPELVDVVDRMFVGYQENYTPVLYSQSFITKDPKMANSGLAELYAENIITDQYANFVPEGSPADTFPAQYGYEKAAYINWFKKNISITRPMRRGAKGNQIERQVRDLIEAPKARLELDLANRFTYAWSTSYVNKEGITVDVTSGDGLAMISGSHTLTGTSTTWSNQVTGNPAFSKSALELAEQIAQRNTFDNLGKNTAFEGKIILSTDDKVTCNQIDELIHATQNVNATGSNTYNVYSTSASGYSHVVAPRIALDSTGARSTTYEKYWFVIDPRLTSFYCTVLDQPYVNMPTAENSGSDFLTENWNFLSGMAYGIAVVSPRGIVGSK